MDKELFEDLVDSIKEAGMIRRGERIPNAETLAAIEESEAIEQLEIGGVRYFDSVEDLMKDLNE